MLGTQKHLTQEGLSGPIISSTQPVGGWAQQVEEKKRGPSSVSIFLRLFFSRSRKAQWRRDFVGLVRGLTDTYCTNEEQGGPAGLGRLCSAKEDAVSQVTDTSQHPALTQHSREPRTSEELVKRASNLLTNYWARNTRHRHPVIPARQRNLVTLYLLMPTRPRILGCIFLDSLPILFKKQDSQERGGSPEAKSWRCWS